MHRVLVALEKENMPLSFSLQFMLPILKIYKKVEVSFSKKHCTDKIGRNEWYLNCDSQILERQVIYQRQPPQWQHSCQHFFFITTINTYDKRLFFCYDHSCYINCNRNKSNRVRQSHAILGVMVLFMIALLIILQLVLVATLKTCLNGITSM